MRSAGRDDLEDVTYIAAADFRLGTLKSYTTGLALTEADGTNAYLDLVIASVTTQVELDLHDDFEPPNPDVGRDAGDLREWPVFLASTPPGPLADDGDRPSTRRARPRRRRATG